MRVALSLLVIACSAASALATPEDMEKFHEVTRIKESSRLSRNSCMTCHTEPPEHNPFGSDLKLGLRASQQSRLDSLIIQSVAAKDSDNDGWTNEQEWKADTLPGDPKSHPEGVPSTLKDRAKSEGEAKASILDQLLPKHSMHPLVIHFPIALFLFGAVLELVGIRKRSDDLRKSAWLCLLFGAISAWFAVPTGLLAFYRVGFSWTGNALIHFVLATASTLLMTGLVLWRRREAHTSTIYIALLITATAGVASAGHFGGLLVYGN